MYFVKFDVASAQNECYCFYLECNERVDSHCPHCDLYHVADCGLQWWTKMNHWFCILILQFHLSLKSNNYMQSMCCAFSSSYPASLVKWFDQFTR